MFNNLISSYISCDYYMNMRSFLQYKERGADKKWNDSMLKEELESIWSLESAVPVAQNLFIQLFRQYSKCLIYLIKNNMKHISQQSWYCWHKSGSLNLITIWKIKCWLSISTSVSVFYQVYDYIPTTFIFCNLYFVSVQIHAIYI